jgi:hypothetical protein
MNIVVEFKDQAQATCDVRVYIHTPRGLGEATPFPPRKRDVSEKHTVVVRLVCIENNCSGNCMMNKQAFETINGRQLHMVCGAFGVVKDSKDTQTVWYEWGANLAEGRTDDFIRSSTQRTSIDSHFWLEDDHGRVYDVLPKYITDVVVPIHQARVDVSELLCNCVIDGIDKEKLRSYGLVYLPVDKALQEDIIRCRMSRMRLVVRK